MLASTLKTKQPTPKKTKNRCEINSQGSLLPIQTMSLAGVKSFSACAGGHAANHGNFNGLGQYINVTI